ncbi:hypothetical protein ACQ2H7_004409 [Candidozyma auris]
MLENPVFVEVSNVKLSCDELDDNVDNKDDDSDDNDDEKDDSNNDEEADETAEERYEEYDEEDGVSDIVCEGANDSDSISSEDSRCVVLGSSSFDEDSLDSWRLDSKDDDNDSNDDEEDDVIDIVCEGDNDSSESISSEDSRCVVLGSSSFADSWRLDSKDDDNDANDDEEDDVVDITADVLYLAPYPSMKKASIRGGLTVTENQSSLTVLAFVELKAIVPKLEMVPDVSETDESNPFNEVT